MEREMRVAITPNTIITALLIISGAYVLWLLRDIVLLVITAIVIASALEPAITFFIRRGIPRFFSTLLMYVLVLGSLFSLIYFFFPPIIADAISFLSVAPQYLNTLSLPGSLSGFANATDLLGSQQHAQSIINSLLVLANAFSNTSGGVVQLFATFFGGVFSLLLVIVLSFYFALQDTGVDDFLRLLIPAKHEDYAVDLWKRSQKKIGRWMQGQLLLSAIVGVLVYIGLLIIGIPYALLIAVFTAFAEIIPIFGSLTAGALAAVVGYSTGGVSPPLIVGGGSLVGD